MSHRILLIFISFLFGLTPVHASPCVGRGTVVLFGNGMLNDHINALNSLRALTGDINRSAIHAGDKPLETDLAYKRNEPILEQLFNVAVQKGITEFDSFWVWLASLEVAPDWFTEEIKSKLPQLLKWDPKYFLDLQYHLERYSKYILKGYNVVLVSHSQGNFYANQAMRHLSAYTDKSLTGSLDDKMKANPLFPQFLDLFANIQVATPVSGTVNASPYSTFKDDLVISLVRKMVGALPANIHSRGAGIPPHGDILGHNFVKAYLRNPESKQQILNAIQAARSRLRYPIAYFDRAGIVEYTTLNTGSLGHFISFDILDDKGKAITKSNERGSDSGTQVIQQFTSCFDIKPGDSRIVATTVVEGGKPYEFSYTVWPGGSSTTNEGQAVKVRLMAPKGSHRWEIGTIHTKAGIGAEPLDLQVEVYSTPKERK